MKGLFAKQSLSTINKHKYYHRGTKLWKYITQDFQGGFIIYERQKYERG